MGFRAVGLAYEDFPQSTDAEVRTLLDTARRDRSLAAH
jgi:predicted phosphoribosyltransferase